MRHYCTLFDVNYLARGLALIASLERHAAPYTLHVLCLDEATHAYFAAHPSPRVLPIPLSRLEEGDADLLLAKGNRSKVEYYFTLSPTLPLRLLQWNPEIGLITYLDADLYFFSDPEAIFKEMGDRSILAISHRFPDHLRPREKNGVYNVGYLSFRRDEQGLACLTWWRERCNEWCYDRVEDDRFADQKYLDRWPELFPGLCVLRQSGAGLAPWNLLNHRLEETPDGLQVDGDPLVFYHFHNFSLLSPRLVLPGTDFYWDRPLPALLRREIFLPYLRELSRILEGNPSLGESLKSRYDGALDSRLLRFFLGRPKLLLVGDRLLSVPAVLTEAFWRPRLERRWRKARNFLLAPFKKRRTTPSVHEENS